MFDYQRVYSILFHWLVVHFIPFISITVYRPPQILSIMCLNSLSHKIQKLSSHGAVRFDLDASSGPFSKQSGLLPNHDHIDPDKCHMNRSLAGNGQVLGETEIPRDGHPSEALLPYLLGSLFPKAKNGVTRSVLRSAWGLIIILPRKINTIWGHPLSLFIYYHNSGSDSGARFPY